MAKKARDLNRFDWDDIRVFLAVAQSRSIRNAAKHLDMHHSTVARRVTSLEAVARRKLIAADVAGRPACELTQDGRRLMDLARQVHDAMDRISLEMHPQGG